jgi:hypothetical protein
VRRFRDTRAGAVSRQRTTCPIGLCGTRLVSPIIVIATNQEQKHKFDTLMGSYPGFGIHTFSAMSLCSVIKPLDRCAAVGRFILQVTVSNSDATG